MWFVILLVIGFSIAPGLCIILLILFCAYMSLKGPGVIIALILMVTYAVYKANQDSARDTTRRDIILNSESKGFVPTKEIREKKYALDYAVYIDETNKKIMFANLLENQRMIYRFDEILDCIVFEDNKVVRTTRIELYPPKENPLVASLNPPRKKVTSMTIKIKTTQDSYEIPVITSPTEFYGEIYVARWQFARNVFDAVQEIINKTNRKIGAGTYKRTLP